MSQRAFKNNVLMIYMPFWPRPLRSGWINKECPNVLTITYLESLGDFHLIYCLILQFKILEISQKSLGGSYRDLHLYFLVRIFEQIFKHQDNDKDRDDDNDP